jgi:DNA-binding transcriptional regulator LsrR (DeoR family)
MPVRRAREILGMKFEAGLAAREIARRTDVPRRTVRPLFKRFGGRGLTWPIAPEVSEADLEALMFKEAGVPRRAILTPRIASGRIVTLGIGIIMR